MQVEREPTPEDLRFQAYTLAHRISFLREERRRGVAPDGELEEKTAELQGLYPVGSNVARTDFEIGDYLEVPDASQGLKSVNCLRVVQVDNPTKSQGATDVVTINLLPEGTPRENLVSALSEILPKNI